MNNKKSKPNKPENEYVTLITDMIKKIFSLIREEYKKHLTKVRLSIILKLNIMYVLRIMSIMSTLNIIILGCYGYFTFRRIEDKMSQSFNEISKEYIMESNVPKERLQLISSLSGFEIRVFDETQKLVYSSNEEYMNKGTEPIIEKLVSFDENRSLENQQFSNLINGKSNAITGEIFRFNYVYEKNLPSNNGQINVKLAFPLYEELRNLLRILLALIIAEVILALLSLRKTAKRSRKILSPINEMIDTVRNITINRMDTRISTGGTQDELKDLAITFNDMLDRIQRAYEIQNQFVSDASHELRTPIAVIQGYAKMLDRWGKQDEKVLDESIEAIKSESENMKDLVEKLLFLARGDKNTQAINMEEFYLNELIDEVVRDTRLIDTEHEIRNNINESIKIYADAKLLKQAIRVFVDNSIKYTPAGGVITLYSFKEGKEAVIAIKDTGIGIDEKDLPNIFNRFYRADKSRTKETGGTGLGLSIAKWIIMKHKGSIQVESALNKGTKVVLRLPLMVPGV